MSVQNVVPLHWVNVEIFQRIGKNRQGTTKVIRIHPQQHECPYKIVWQSMRYFRPDHSGWPTASVIWISQVMFSPLFFLPFRASQAVSSTLKLLLPSPLPISIWRERPHLLDRASATAKTNSVTVRCHNNVAPVCLVYHSILWTWPWRIVWNVSKTKMAQNKTHHKSHDVTCIGFSLNQAQCDTTGSLQWWAHTLSSAHD